MQELIQQNDEIKKGTFDDELEEIQQKQQIQYINTYFQNGIQMKEILSSLKTNYHKILRAFEMLLEIFNNKSQFKDSISVSASILLVVTFHFYMVKDLNQTIKLWGDLSFYMRKYKQMFFHYLSNLNPSTILPEIRFSILKSIFSYTTNDQERQIANRFTKMVNFLVVNSMSEFKTFEQERIQISSDLHQAATFILIFAFGNQIVLPQQQWKKKLNALDLVVDRFISNKQILDAVTIHSIIQHSITLRQGLNFLNRQIKDKDQDIPLKVKQLFQNLKGSLVKDIQSQIKMIKEAQQSFTTSTTSADYRLQRFASENELKSSQYIIASLQSINEKLPEISLLKGSIETIQVKINEIVTQSQNLISAFQQFKNDNQRSRQTENLYKAYQNRTQQKISNMATEIQKQINSIHKTIRSNQQEITAFNKKIVKDINEKFSEYDRSIQYSKGQLITAKLIAANNELIVGGFKDKLDKVSENLGKVKQQVQKSFETFVTAFNKKYFYQQLQKFQTNIFDPRITKIQSKIQLNQSGLDSFRKEINSKISTYIDKESFNEQRKKNESALSTLKLQYSKSDLLLENLIKKLQESINLKLTTIQKNITQNKNGILELQKILLLNAKTQNQLKDAKNKYQTSQKTIKQISTNLATFTQQFKSDIEATKLEIQGKITQLQQNMKNTKKQIQAIKADVSQISTQASVLQKKSIQNINKGIQKIQEVVRKSQDQLNQFIQQRQFNKNTLRKIQNDLAKILQFRILTTQILKRLAKRSYSNTITIQDLSKSLLQIEKKVGGLEFQVFASQYTKAKKKVNSYLKYFYN